MGKFLTGNTSPQKHISTLGCRMSGFCVHTLGWSVHSPLASDRHNSVLMRRKLQCSPWRHGIFSQSRGWCQRITPSAFDALAFTPTFLQVKSGDSEGIPSSEGMILDEQSLEQELQKAIEEENYVQAAKIRDSLRVLHEDGKASILAANARFYDAFKNGDLAAMHTIWSKGDNIFCVHPGAGGISGYDLVMGSWELVCGADYEFPLQIELKNIEVHVKGDMGYVTCMEVIKTRGSSWGKQVATNVFERIDGQWFICIHHASHVDLRA